EIPLSGCQITPRSTSEPQGRSDLVDSSAVLIRDGFTFLHTDRIRVPAGKRMAGEWSIDGRPGEWPGSFEVALKRA
ncbi:MAG: ArV2 gp08, partial [Pseudarthrobacter sp.]|nr:ArV2 gp08 [Pseudarthrobacter sp.]